MKIDKIKNKYQVRKMIKGKTYYLYFIDRPTKSDIKNALIQKLQSENMRGAAGQEKEPTLYELIQAYINNRQDTLSPSTIKGYIYILRVIPKTLLDKSPTDITINDIQAYINSIAKTKSPKTIKNIISLILAAIPDRPNKKIIYPRKIANDVYIPTDNDIKIINDKLKGTKYYIFFRLCLYGLRVSEILGLTIQDISNGYININKSKVLDINQQWQVKTTKTIKSTRKIKVNEELTTQILNQGYILNITYKQFYNHFTKLLTKLNINYFSPHKLRHYIASKMHSLNIPTKYICEYGGWATDNVLKNVYTHTIQNQTKIYIDKLNKNINQIIGG